MLIILRLGREEHHSYKIRVYMTSWRHKHTFYKYVKRFDRLTDKQSTYRHKSSLFFWTVIILGFLSWTTRPWSKVFLTKKCTTTIERCHAEDTKLSKQILRESTHIPIWDLFLVDSWYWFIYLVTWFLNCPPNFFISPVFGYAVN